MKLKIPYQNRKRIKNRFIEIIIILIPIPEFEIKGFKRFSNEISIFCKYIS